MDVTVRKTNGSFEEYDKVKLMNGIREAYKTAGEECPEAVVVSIAENLYIYDKITSREIRRQVEESLMSINKKVAIAYIEKFDAGLDLRKKRDFIKDYIAASKMCRWICARCVRPCRKARSWLSGGALHKARTGRTGL